MPPQPHRPPARRRGRVVVIAAVLGAVGLVAVLGGGYIAARELTREPTKDEVAAATTKEVALRWRNRPAAELFPATVKYDAGHSKTAKPIMLSARRIAMAAPAQCRDAFDKNVVAALAKHGCQTVLRAVYLDASATQVLTLGVAVMATRDQGLGAQQSVSNLSDKYGVRVPPLAGTIAARFGDRQRQAFEVRAVGPYLLAMATGYTDGRRPVGEDSLVHDFTFADLVVSGLSVTLSKQIAVCKAPEVHC